MTGVKKLEIKMWKSSTAHINLSTNDRSVVEEEFDQITRFFNPYAKK